MRKRYRSAAMVTDGQPQPAVPQDADSHFAHTT